MRGARLVDQVQHRLVERRESHVDRAGQVDRERVLPEGSVCLAVGGDQFADDDRAVRSDAVPIRLDAPQHVSVDAVSALVESRPQRGGSVATDLEIRGDVGPPLLVAT